MKYIIIGLGKFGSILAEELTSLGHEVIGADVNEHHVNLMKDKIEKVYLIDASNEQSMSILPVAEVDAVIVAIGEHFAASIKVVAILKKMKAKQIMARAIDKMHEAVFSALQVDKILHPEKDAARRLARSLELHYSVSSYKVDSEHYVIQFETPNMFVGTKINDLHLNEKFHIKLLAVKRGKMTKDFMGSSVLDYSVENILEGEFILQPKDTLVAYGKYSDFRKLWRKF